MKTAGADYVFLTTTPSISAKIIGTGAALGYMPQWIMQSPASRNSCSRCQRSPHCSIPRMGRRTGRRLG